MHFLYTDENYPVQVAELLRHKGHDILTAQEAQQAGFGVDDPEVLSFAVQLGRAVITRNRRHFFKLHRLTRGCHAGIILCTQDESHSRQADRIHAALSQCVNLNRQIIKIYCGGHLLV